MGKMAKKLAGILALTMAFTCISPATRVKEVKAGFIIEADHRPEDTYIDAKPKKLYTLGVGEEGLVCTTNKKKKTAVATSIKISNPKVVTVKSEAALNTIKAKKPGKATVTFKTKDGNKIKVNIKVVPVTMIQKGNKVAVTGSSSTDRVYVYGGKVTKWTSSNPELLQLVNKGKYVKLVVPYYADKYNPFKVYTVKVTAKVGKKTYSKNVKVGYFIQMTGNEDEPYDMLQGERSLSKAKFKYYKELYNVSDEEVAAYYNEFSRLDK